MRAVDVVVRQCEAVVVVLGPPLDRGRRHHAGQATSIVKDVLSGDKTLPVKAGGAVVGEATCMDRVLVDGHAALLFAVRLTKPISEFMRRADGALVGRVQTCGSHRGLFPMAVEIFDVEVCG